MKYQAGFKFMDALRDYEVIEFMSKFNMYRVNNITDNRQDELLPESEINELVNNKEQILLKREKNEKFRQKQEQLIKQQEAAEKEKEYQYNNTYGYTDNLKPLQKGKILKTLNVKVNYSRYGILTRKEFIYKAIQEGFTPEIAYNVNYWTRNGIKTKAKEYQINFGDYYNTITKTEYDYAMFLLNNKIILPA